VGAAGSDGFPRLAGNDARIQRGGERRHWWLMMNPRTTLTADRLMAHTGWVRRLARTLVRAPAAADDLAHDALLVALDRPPEVREGIRSWFGRVLTNRLRMDARASRRRAAREQAVTARSVWRRAAPSPSSMPCPCSVGSPATRSTLGCATSAPAPPSTSRCRSV